MAVNNISLSQSIDFSSALKTLFPKEEYTKSTKQNVVLHYFLVHSPLSALKGWVAKLDTPEKKNYLSHRSTNQLSPLDICAILGKIEEANLLAEKGANCEKPDSMGRTPLHYASLVHGESSELFAKFAKAVLKTDQKVDLFLRGSDAQYLNLDRLLDRTLPKPTDIVFDYRDAQGKIAQGTAEEFFKMTGAQFSDRVLTTPRVVLMNWLERSAKPEVNDPYKLLEKLRLAFNLHKNNLVKVFIGKDEECPVGYDIYAGENIDIGTIIRVYSGEEKDAFTKTVINDYQLSLVDASKLRNLAAIANHGFPNAAVYSLYDFDGFSEFHLMVAIEPIKNGDKIVWNFGVNNNVIKDKDRVEIRKKELQAYLQKNTVESMIKEYDSKLKETNYKACIEREAIRDRLSYLFQDPHAFRFMLTIINNDVGQSLYLMMRLNDPSFLTSIGINEMVYVQKLKELCKEMYHQKKISDEAFQKVLK